MMIMKMMYCIVLYLLNFIDVHQYSVHKHIITLQCNVTNQYSVWKHICHISQFTNVM